MITVRGQVIDIDNIDYDRISLFDLCHNLENINRFCGATTPLLPVAWHCVELASLFADRMSKLQALFHEFDEPFISDIPQAVKEKFPEIREFGHKICEGFCRKYGVDYPFNPEVHRLDSLLGDYEARIFFSKPHYGKKYDGVRDSYRGVLYNNIKYAKGSLLEEITKWL